MNFKKSIYNILSFCSVLVSVSLGSAHATPVYLSDFLGVSSGGTTFTSNSPYTTVLEVSSWGFGADVLGNFSADQINFNDAGPFSKGIGAHPTQFGESRIEFDLNALRSDGFSFNTFSTIVGIGPSVGGNQGALFNVYLDSVLTETASVAGVGYPSLGINVLLGSASTLTLGSSRVGSWNGNHAVWADARLFFAGGGTPVPVPGTFFLLGSGLVGLIGYNCRCKMKIPLKK